jgi:hypothetical protein
MILFDNTLGDASHCYRWRQRCILTIAAVVSPALVQSGKNIRAAKLQRQTTIITLTNESDATRRHELTICLEMDKLALAQVGKNKKQCKHTLSIYEPAP